MFIFSHFTSQHYLVFEWSHPVVYWFYVFTWLIIQGDSITRGPKLLSIKSYVIEIITWKFIYTYRERCKTGPAHNRCWHLSPFTSKHTSMLFSRENHPVYICQNNYRVILSLEAPNKFGKKFSRIWRNAFKCAWMWKETSFSIDYEQVLFCIFPGMCI